MIGITACTIEYVMQYLVLIVVNVIQYLLKDGMVRFLGDFTWHARLGWRLFMRNPRPSLSERNLSTSHCRLWANIYVHSFLGFACQKIGEKLHGREMAWSKSGGQTGYWA